MSRHRTRPTQDPFEARRAVLEPFAAEGETLWSEIVIDNERYPRLVGEFWTAMQRQASNLHEVSYRACYKPQLPRLFIERFTEPGDRVYDPFSGRGTTIVESALLGRRVAANDVNPLSEILARPRLSPPDLHALEERLHTIPKKGNSDRNPDLSMFYHPDTEGELQALRAYLLERESGGSLDEMDAWIRMVATNRLTGHSKGFFSVYTLPPNQACSAEKQRQINVKLEQAPEYRDVHALILKKSKQLMKGLDEAELSRLGRAAQDALFCTGDARSTKEIGDETVKLTVTSPPFLDVVDYTADNWLRCWFNGLDAEVIGQGITMARTAEAWAKTMQDVFFELYRITCPSGFVAFEVGEVRKGTVRLEEVVLPLGLKAGFEPFGVLVNQQSFTKTSNIWGVDNNTKGTNSNRIALFGKA